MNGHYSYDDIYGTLIYQNEADDMRKYFVIECQSYKFYIWMFQYGWNKTDSRKCERKGLKGREITLQREDIK